MRSQQLEARVSTLVEHVVAGGRIEDDRVEAKATWPTNHRRAARQIAGLANASGGEAVLWIVGLDEDAHRVVSPGPEDPASWWGQTARAFADVAPDVSLLTVPTAAGTVVVLEFDTSRAPYLVTTQGAGGVDREVPWRQGNATRSAHRHELIRSLVGQTQAPQMQMIGAALRAKVTTDGMVSLEFHMSAFLECVQPCRLPVHLWEAHLTIGDFCLPIEDLSIAGTGSIDLVRGSALHVNGSDTIRISCRVDPPGVVQGLRPTIRRARKALFDLRLPLALSSRVGVLHVEMARRKLVPLTPISGSLSSQYAHIEDRIGEFLTGDGYLDSYEGRTATSQRAPELEAALTAARKGE